MPEKQTIKRARRELREGKAPTTAAGELVREEIEHIRKGQHGVRSTKQAIAIGLSKARRAGIPLAPPKPGQASSRTRTQAKRDVQQGKHPSKPSRTRANASKRALERESRSPASRQALSRHAKEVARNRRRAAAR